MAHRMQRMRNLLEIGAAAIAAFVSAVVPACAGATVLRVCADPNNLPFSNRNGEGFENKIVALLAHDLGATVTYTWWAQRRGFVRHTLKAQICDLWPGVATKLDMLRTTRPYYRSSYMFVTRTDRDLKIDSFDDPQLHNLKIGVQMVGNDATNTPPAHALAQRGITANVRGFMLYGDYTQPDPTAAIVDSVARGDVDVALVWGPLAGYFAAREPQKLSLLPVAASADDAALPMSFEISMGVRKGDAALAAQLDRWLLAERPAIDAILTAYHIPRMALPSSDASSAH